MQPDSDRISYLLRRFTDKQATATEKEELMEWLAEREDDGTFRDHVFELLHAFPANKKMEGVDWETIYSKIEARKDEGAIPVHRVHFLKTAWFKYAAAILLLITGIATYFFIHTSQSQVEVAQTTPSPLPKQDVLPGSDKAILTLSNGQQVQLNNATSETIKDGTLSIENNNGQLIYGDLERGSLSPAGGSGREAAEGGSRSARTATNTMQTPKGGQYKLTLSDGTKVWLNAASSITYPIAFTAKTREVSITGEAYFEVTKNKEKPFIVKTIKEEITVLGTQFNVNAYPDEPTTKTSLLEGSVRISPAGTASGTLSPAGGSTPSEARGEGGSREARTATRNGVILKPGEAFINGKITKTDLTQDIAWKNGLFNFNGADLPSVLRQLQRWYDIEVKYEGEIKKREFSGELHRDLTLIQVTNILKEMDVQFRLEGRTLFVK